ncbi:MAG: response regulator [Myxococcales bacterium]|nr:response regulator [Myxococcota bacterium]MDW8281297.1 response regulator [Myxococcales bacterium]
MSAPKPEVLIVAGDEQEHRDLQRFISDLGLGVVGTRDGSSALGLAEGRPFALALVDADTPGAGLELLRSLRKIRPAMSVVLLTARRSFDLVLGALREGAADVVVKAPDQIDYLRQRVLALAGAASNRADRERLLAESVAINEEFLRRLTDMARRVGDLRDKLLSVSSGNSPLPEDEECRVLIVEEDGWLGQALGSLLPRGFLLHSVVSGGSALDKASAQRFHIALVKEGLPDLPGRMVVRTLQAQSPETITLLFSPPGKHPGKVEVLDGMQVISLLPSFTDAAQLAARLQELRDAQRARGRERRYLAAFREEHYELLKRYADFRMKMRPE